MSAATSTNAATVAESTAMRRAFDLARRGPAHGPNPRVGCVLLGPDGSTLGEGFHRGAGTPHAEVAALQDAAERGTSRSTRRASTCGSSTKTPAP